VGLQLEKCKGNEEFFFFSYFGLFSKDLIPKGCEERKARIDQH
jgi:hypothetical protein